MNADDYYIKDLKERADEIIKSKLSHIGIELNITKAGPGKNDSPGLNISISPAKTEEGSVNLGDNYLNECVVATSQWVNEPLQYRKTLYYSRYLFWTDGGANQANESLKMINNAIDRFLASYCAANSDWIQYEQEETNDEDPFLYLLCGCKMPGYINFNGKAPSTN